MICQSIEQFQSITKQASGSFIHSDFVLNQSICLDLGPPPLRRLMKMEKFIIVRYCCSIRWFNERIAVSFESLYRYGIT